MDANSFIEKCIYPLIMIEKFKIISSCDVCGKSAVNVIENEDKTNTCIVCDFMQSPNADLFGMLTNVRAHSPISFLNSLIIFDETDHLTLVVSERYAELVPVSSFVKFVVYGVNEFIINLLNNPSKRVIIKPTIRYEEFAENLMISDDRSVYISTSKGGYCINLDVWQKLSKLVKLNDRKIVDKAIGYMQSIAKGEIANTDKDVRDFVEKNQVLMIKFNDLLSMDIHSRLFILNLLKVVCHEAV